jgi:hypothetical protein
MYAPTSLVKCFIATATGANWRSGIDKTLLKLDRLVREHRTRMYKVATMVGLLLRKVLDRETMRANVAVGYALAAYEHWQDLGARSAWELPDKRQVERLRKVDWYRYAPDSKMQWATVVRDEVLKRWKVK